MSVSPAFRYVRCDGPRCGEVFEVDSAHRPVNEQRASFSLAGWHRWRGLDLCPGCWPQRLELSGEVQPNG